MAKRKKNPLIKYIDTFAWVGKPAVILIFVFGILADILFFPSSSDIIFFGMLAMYIVGAILFNISSTTTFLIALVVFILMYIQFLLTGTSEVTENAAVWLFLLLTLGILQQWRELSK